LEGGGFKDLASSNHAVILPVVQVKTILNRVEKFKSFVFKKTLFEPDPDTEERIVVEIEPRKNSKPRCGGCRKPAPGYDTRAEARDFEFVPLWGIKVFFRYRMRRVDCPRCQGVKSEFVPWAEGKSPLTTSYKLFLARWARRLSWQETALVFNTSWQSVYRSVKWVVEWGMERRDLDGITAIGVDEVHVGQRNFITILYQIDEGSRRILGIARGKSKESLRELIEGLGLHVASIRYVCTDMSQAYLSVIAGMLNESVSILDRFHIVQALNKALDQVRNEEAKALAKQGITALKGTKYCFLKNPKNLTKNQKTTLKDLTALGLKTMRAYQLKELFQGLWAYESPAWARKFLHAWCNRAMRSRIGPLKRFARTMRKHEPLVVNYFEAKKQFSSGVVEGLNRKINLITRKSYGFRSEEIRNIMLFHTLGQLPEPARAHDF
jgi:transposase